MSNAFAITEWLLSINLNLSFVICIQGVKQVISIVLPEAE